MQQHQDLAEAQRQQIEEERDRWKRIVERMHADLVSRYGESIAKDIVWSARDGAHCEADITSTGRSG